jgi:hypothetical protein
VSQSEDLFSATCCKAARGSAEFTCAQADIVKKKNMIAADFTT